MESTKLIYVSRDQSTTLLVVVGTVNSVTSQLYWIPATTWMLEEILPPNRA